MADELPPFIDARDKSEANFLLNYLQQSGYINTMRSTISAEKRKPTGGGTVIQIEMSVKGWEALSPVAGAGIAGTCFVAMSFDPWMTEAFEIGMVPAIEDDCGFRVVSIDRVQYNDEITDRILGGIRAAQFVVADFTQQRPGVYFEAGFALALGRTVIWTCHANDFGNLHFDTRQRSHIKWENAADLRRQLAERIKATVSLPARLS